MVTDMCRELQQAFEKCVEFYNSVGEDTRSVINDMTHNITLIDRVGWHVCRKCKRPQGHSVGNNDALIANQLCFGCDLWERRAESNLLKPNVFVVGRTMYSIGTPSISKQQRKLLGHGGQCFELTDESGVKHYTNNLWCGGDLPFWLVDGYNTATMREITMKELNNV
jgi:hypothetical protein